jgi:eukaryotic-like serine/threonine-protein kinase
VSESAASQLDSGGQSVSDSSKRYDVLMELGRGGTAVVHAAMARGPGGFSKLVVLKTTRQELMDTPDAVSMFLKEARLSARMNHANVVQVYEVYEDQGLPVIVMEYLDGQSLAAFFTRYFAEPGYDVRVPLSILCKALEGLHYAHSLTDFDGRPLKIVHRDVTPQNIVVTYDGQVKLLDFGIAKLDVASETRTGTIKGKLGYMSRQQVDGSELDCRSDVFAVGVMIWEVVARRRMWRGLPEAAVLKHLLCDEIPDLRSIVPDVDAELARICERALAPDPNQRYADARELLLELQAWLDARGGAVVGSRLGALVSHTCSEARQKFQQRLDAELRRFSTKPDGDWSDAGPAPPGARELRGSGQWPQRAESGTHIAYTDKPRSPTSRYGALGLWALGCMGVVLAAAVAWSALQRGGPEVDSHDSTSAVTAVVLDNVTRPVPVGAAESSSGSTAERAAELAPGKVTARSPGHANTSATERASQPPAHVAAKAKPTTAAKRPPAGVPRARRAAGPDACDPPYVIDELGIKRYRRECL